MTHFLREQAACLPSSNATGGDDDRTEPDCSAFGQASENIVRVYYGDLVRASIWNGDHMVMYRHDFCFALVFSQHMLESEVLPIADLAIVPVRSCRAKNHDDGIIHFSHLLKGKELFEKQIPS